MPIQSDRMYPYDSIDKTASYLWPNDADQGLVPLRVYGDGNCLFRSVSVLCSGKEESLHIELRARTLCELILHPDYYLSSDKCSSIDYEGVVMKNILPACSANYSNEGRLQADIAFEVFALDCLDSVQSGKYANMWHIYALASVLKQPIVSVYPHANIRVRPAFNRTVYPRLLHENPLRQSDSNLVVMWTNLLNTNCQNWSPNHFVPCIPCNKLLKEPTFTIVSRPKRKLYSRVVESIFISQGTQHTSAFTYM